MPVECRFRAFSLFTMVSNCYMTHPLSGARTGSTRILMSKRQANSLICVPHELLMIRVIINSWLAIVIIYEKPQATFIPITNIVLNSQVSVKILILKKPLLWAPPRSFQVFLFPANLLWNIRLFFLCLLVLTKLFFDPKINLSNSFRSNGISLFVPSTCLHQH